jgi:hypothetical protein
MTMAKKFFLVTLFLVSVLSSSSAQMTRQWVARFSGTLKNSNNAATAMTVDDSGYVYVAGWVTRPTTGIDFATVKYSPDGEMLWQQYFAGSGSSEDKPTAIALDTAYNVYVTGSSSGGSGLDYVTIKYKADGTDSLWMRRYNGPGNGDDKPVALAVNDSLNVYVTGWSLGAGTGLDYATLKYDASGALKFEKRYDGPTSKADSALGMALRGSTDLFVTGTSVDSAYDYETIKYNAATGDTIWTRRYDGPSKGFDIARAVVARSSSELYVTGSSMDTLGRYDYLTIRYNGTTGDTIWTARYNGSANGDDQALAIGLQSNSRVYVTGRSVNAGSYSDIVTCRYNQSNGNLSWVSSYNGPANDDDYGVALIPGGTPSVAGPSAGIGTGKDYALVELNSSSGNPQTELRYNGPANADDIPAAIASSGGALFITGRSASKAKGYEWLTIKYVNQGSMKYRSITQDSLIGKGVNLKSLTAVPNFANVRDEAFLKAYPKIKKGFAGYPGGLTLGNARRDSALTYGWIRFDKGSNIAKFVPHTYVSRGFDVYGASVFVGEKKNPKLDKYNNHLVGELLALRINIGASDAEVTPPTFGDLTYDDGDTSNHFNGMSLRQLASTVDNYLTYWAQYPVVNWSLLDSMMARTNRAFSGPLKIVSKSPLVVTGAVHIDSVFFLQPGIAPLANPLTFPADAVDETIPQTFALEQNYPNPFNPTTTIEFALPAPGAVSMKIYDILGREVATLLDGELLEEGSQDVTFDAQGFSSGVYFYRIVVNGGEFQQMKKMMLMK